MQCLPLWQNSMFTHLYANLLILKSLRKVVDSTQTMGVFTKKFCESRGCMHQYVVVCLQIPCFSFNNEGQEATWTHQGPYIRLIVDKKRQDWSPLLDQRSDGNIAEVYCTSNQCMAQITATYSYNAFIIGITHTRLYTAGLIAVCISTVCLYSTMKYVQYTSGVKFLPENDVATLSN